jgi:Alpha/beta hydrolase family
MGPETRPAPAASGTGSAPGRPPRHAGEPPAVSGERIFIDDPRCGRFCLHVAGDGPPLLLVHSVNAAASAAEVRPLHEHCRASRTVFSIDLPGYGASLRSNRPYTPRLMTDALHAAVAHIQARCGAAPVDALAVSLACEFLARAATEASASLRRIALVSPTGFNGRSPPRGAPGSTRHLPWLDLALRGPGGRWGGVLFRALTRPGVIRYFLRRTWGSPDIDEEMYRHAVWTTRQPGAEFAPLSFLSAAMFSADIGNVYERLTQPVWVSHGVRGDFTDYRGLHAVSGRPNWSVDVFQTGAMPYFEVPVAFNAALDRFLQAPA